MTGTFDAAEWERRVRPKFDFLVSDFGFSYHGADTSTNYLTRATYQSKTTEVNIDDSDEFSQVEVLLVRRVRGRTPSYPVGVPRHHFPLDLVLMRRAPQTRAQVNALTHYESGNVESALTALADALREHAKDILRGDFALFPELERQVRESWRSSKS